MQKLKCNALLRIESKLECLVNILCDFFDKTNVVALIMHTHKLTEREVKVYYSSYKSLAEVMRMRLNILQVTKVLRFAGVWGKVFQIFFHHHLHTFMVFQLYKTATSISTKASRSLHEFSLKLLLVFLEMDEST